MDFTESREAPTIWITYCIHMCSLIIVSKLFPRDRTMSSQSDINHHISVYQGINKRHNTMHTFGFQPRFVTIG